MNRQKSVNLSAYPVHKYFASVGLRMIGLSLHSTINHALLLTVLRANEGSFCELSPYGRELRHIFENRS
jgi:hypothetical protein